MHALFSFLLSRHCILNQRFGQIAQSLCREAFQRTATVTSLLPLYRAFTSLCHKLQAIKDQGARNTAKAVRLKFHTQVLTTCFQLLRHVDGG